MKNCKGCEFIPQRIPGDAPFWGSIYRTSYWDIAHSYDTALPDWLVLVARCHITAVRDLNDTEAVELGYLIHRTSVALKEVTGCDKTYLIQLAETADHPHVHFHIIPRMADQPENRHSTQMFGYLGVPEDERVYREAMNAIATKVREWLHAYEIA